MSAFTPLTGRPCTCKRGEARDNCPACEGTGKQIDFRAIHAARRARELAAAQEQQRQDEERGMPKGELAQGEAEAARREAAVIPPYHAPIAPGETCPRCRLLAAAELAAVLEADAGPTVAQVAALIPCEHGAETPCYLCRMSDGVQVDR